MRLHELAKEIGVASKELLGLAREIGLNIKSHSSNLAAGEESILRFAMKQELEERAEKEAPKPEKVEAPKEAEKTPEVEAEEVKKGEEPEPAPEKTEEVDEAIAEKPDSEEQVTAEPAPEDAVADKKAPTAKKTKETPAEAKAKKKEPEEAEEKPKKAKKAKPKKKKTPPKRAGATILGRINLPSLDEIKKKTAKAKEAIKAQEKETKAPVSPVEDPLEPPLIAPEKGGKAAASKKDLLMDEDKLGKTRRYIKPKQQPAVFDPEEDPLLQGIQIRHWNKKNRSRKPSFRHLNRNKRRVKKTKPVVYKKVEVAPPIAVKDLSQLTGIKVQDMLMKFIAQGEMKHINTMLNEEEVLQVAIDFNREIEIVEAKDADQVFQEQIQENAAALEEDSQGKAQIRAPIVAFLGHVDHGKTSLLDAIREANVADSEYGGITQHVSAYRVDTENGAVVFLDTPGHKAFTEMRARGANVTDIVVLIVAADDGVMPQTEEAIQHAQAAETPIVVAINKVDRPNANPNRVKQQLAGLGIMTEDWGGEVGCVEVSAITKQGIPELLERLVLEAEIQELKSNPDQLSRGVVFESRKDVEKGNIVTLLVQDGTVRIRDTIIAGEHVYKVRAMTNDRGKPITEAGPSTPVNVIGFDALPESGTQFNQVESAAKAREISEVRRNKRLLAEGAPENKYAITLENLFESIEAGKVAEIRVVLKADVKGTLEVLKRSMEDLQHEEVKVKLIRDGIGAITEDDVLLAIASQAVIIGFHTAPEEKAKRIADENDVEIRTYRVIYQLLDDLRLAMEGALKPLKKEIVTAHLEIREVFKSSRLGAIAGCYVLDGVINRKNNIRVKRGEEVLFEGEMASLKRFTEDQREVKEGFECGVKIVGFDGIKAGDILESFEIVEEKRTLKLE